MYLVHYQRTAQPERPRLPRPFFVAVCFCYNQRFAGRPTGSAPGYLQEFNKAPLKHPPTRVNKNIILIGLMGTGKTTVGRQLAKRLKRDFYDSDRVIEERTGADIPLIFEKEGEQGFRSRETAIIDELTQMQGIILATGGGAILSEQNRQYLSERGVVIYLKSNLKTLVERTSKDKNRPLLHADEPAEVILQRLLDQREPLYEEIADIIVFTANNSIHKVIQAIIGKLKNFPETQ